MNRLSMAVLGVILLAAPYLLTERVADPQQSVKDHVRGTVRSSQVRQLQTNVGDLQNLLMYRYPVLQLSETPDTIMNSIGMRFTLIPAGQFQMGSTPQQIAKVHSLDSSIKKEFADDEQPRHQVRITKPFYLGVHEVTRGQFAQFVKATGYRTEAEKDGQGGRGWNEEVGRFEGRDPQYTWRSTGFPYEDDHPVVNVTWNDAVAFAEWLSEQDGRRYRLPTEAEWEYACRAGTDTLFEPGDDPERLARVGNVADATAQAKWENYQNYSYLRSRDGHVFTAPVGSYRANGFGLYDMHGNVWEWCSDWYRRAEYGAAATRDPTGPSEGSYRVARGGSWGGTANGCRSANRAKGVPSYRNYDLGFRLAAVPAGRSSRR